jgi:hypothetical protein
MKSNYDGYKYEGLGSVFCPLSVTSAARERSYESFWNKTDTFESLSDLIAMDFYGLKGDVIKILAGESVTINTARCQNDLGNVASRDDVFTALAHLGYLGFNETGEFTGEVFIPNWEVAKQYEIAVEEIGLPQVAKLIDQSKKLLQATWDLDGDFVAERLDEVHALESSVLNYNDENSLACAVLIAYFAAKEYYLTFRELPAGKGFADVVFLPNGAYPAKPALLVELKWNSSAESAIDQIKRKQYPPHLQNYKGTLLLVGLNYDKKTKKHKCLIEMA